MKSKGWCCDCEYFKVLQRGDKCGICKQFNTVVTGMKYHDNCSRWKSEEYERYDISSTHKYNERCLK